VPDVRRPQRLLLLVVAVAATNIDPLPTVAGRDPRPAGVIRVVVSTKAEHEEIAVVEPMVEMIMEMITAPCSASTPSLNSSTSHRRCGHRATTD
jgi:hypothetical protein